MRKPKKQDREIVPYTGPAWWGMVAAINLAPGGPQRDRL